MIGDERESPGRRKCRLINWALKALGFLGFLGFLEPRATSRCKLIGWEMERGWDR
jgi:hypothetical protein